MGNSRSNSPLQDYRSPLLTKALQKYRSELRGGDNIVLEAESLEQLLTHAKSFETSFLRNSNQSSPLNRLESIFSYFNDFAAVMAVCFGADAKVAGVFWGSIRIILTVLPLAAFKVRKTITNQRTLVGSSIKGYSQRYH